MNTKRTHTAGFSLLSIIVVIIVLIIVGIFYYQTERPQFVQTVPTATTTADVQEPVATSTAVANDNGCPYGTNPIKTTKTILYVNSAMHFQLNIPSGWYIPNATDTDPHFYTCENGVVTNGFELTHISGLNLTSSSSASYKLSGMQTIQQTTLDEESSWHYAYNMKSTKGQGFILWTFNPFPTYDFSSFKLLN